MVWEGVAKGRREAYSEVVGIISEASDQQSDPASCMLVTSAVMCGCKGCGVISLFLNLGRVSSANFSGGRPKR